MSNEVEKVIRAIEGAFVLIDIQAGAEDLSRTGMREQVRRILVRCMELRDALEGNVTSGYDASSSDDESKT